MLPFLLGLLGMFYQYRKGKTGKQDFWVVMLLFIMTGIAIIVFLNQTPMEPRERDYAYAGSFYAYAIWIGLGVLSIWEFLNKNGYRPLPLLRSVCSPFRSIWPPKTGTTTTVMPVMPRQPMPVITSIRVLRMQFYLLMEITILSHCGMYKKWKEYGGMSGSSI